MRHPDDTSPRPQTRTEDPPLVPCVYLTNEQIHRLGQMACDAMVGVQVHTDASDHTYLTFDFVPIDTENMAETEHGVIYTDGSWVRTT